MDSEIKQLQQMLPVPLLAKFRNLEFSPNDDLALMQDIATNGIQEPVVLGVGVWSRRARLDTGNHRIYLAPRMGLMHLPVVCRVWNYCSFSNGNGDHSYDCPHITPKREWIQEEYWARPSDVLDIFELMKEMAI